MKNCEKRICVRQPFRLFVLLTVLLILVGCGKKPSPSVETATPTNESMAANDKAAAVEPEAESGTSQASVAKPQKVVVKVPAFLDAALNGKIETVRNAIQSGVDVNSTEEGKRTALHLASFNGHTSVVKLLLEHGATVGQRDAAGRTALMFAATGANAETAGVLLDAGAAVNAVDTDEKFTALMHAAAEGQAKVVELLLQHKADPAIRDADGDTARDFASKNGHAEVVKLLTR